jgi:DNA (cytosine-5)-methyltransferase 1
MRRRKLLVADLLCGAGGSSTGCALALRDLGLEMELVCVNHWPVAIDTHTKNHPKARHYCQDISTVRPHRVVPEGYLDLLMASPSCTHHSVARGGKPTSDQQRSDPWHILTWLTELRVKRLIIENVWEFTNWGPVDRRTGKPIKSRKGEYFDAWIKTIQRFGFDPEWRKLNAADYGEATTRQRFILMARNDRRRVLWPVATHGKNIEGLIPWRPAREIIDWNIKGRSIFNRKRPLAPKTLARIHAGAVKFNWPEPFLVILRNHMDGKSVDGPLPTIAAGGTHIGLATPIILSPRHGKKNAGPRPRQVNQSPLPTITAGGSQIALVEPFILNRHGEGYGETRAHSIDQPTPTANCRGAGYLIEPFVLSRHGEGAPRSIEQPTPTQVAKHSHCLISPYYGSGSGETCQTVRAPLPTVTSKARFGMVIPITHSDGSNRARDVDADPLPTLTTAHRGEQALIEATPQYDILFRMLEDHELAAAMGFDGNEAPYEFVGTKTERIKQVGNAVSVRKMKACVKALLADAARPARSKWNATFSEAAE